MLRRLERLEAYVPLITSGKSGKTHGYSCPSYCIRREFLLMIEEGVVTSISELRKDEQKLRIEKELATLNLKTWFKTAIKVQF